MTARKIEIITFKAQLFLGIITALVLILMIITLFSTSTVLGTISDSVAIDVSLTESGAVKTSKKIVWTYESNNGDLYSVTTNTAKNLPKDNIVYIEPKTGTYFFLQEKINIQILKLLIVNMLVLSIIYFRYWKSRVLSNRKEFICKKHS